MPISAASGLSYHNLALLYFYLQRTFNDRNTFTVQHVFYDRNFGSTITGIVIYAPGVKKL